MRRNRSSEVDDKDEEPVELCRNLQSLRAVGDEGEELVELCAKLQSLEDVEDGDKELGGLGENLQIPEEVKDRDEDWRNTTRTLGNSMITKRALRISKRNSMGNSERNTKRNSKMLQKMALLPLLPQPRPELNILWKRILLRHK